MLRYRYLPVIASAVLVFAGCAKKTTETESEFTKITNVEIFTVKLSTFEDFITLPVVVTPDKEVHLGLTGGGKVTKITVDKGDRVTEGMTLLETDDVLLKANYDMARAALEYQENEFARSEKLFREGSITEAAFDAAKLQRAQAQSSFDIAKKQYEDAVLKAPFAGVVTSRSVEVGDILGPGSPAFRIIDMSRVKIQAGIPEKYITDFTVGNTVSIVFDALGDVRFTGKIHYISPEADTSVRTFLAEILVNNPKGLLKTGIMGDASILRNVHENAVMIPINAVIETQFGRIVFIARENNTAEERSIKIGNSNGTRILVTDGIEPGERIIGKGQHDLVDGEPVNITGEYRAFTAEDTES